MKAFRIIVYIIFGLIVLYCTLVVVFLTEVSHFNIGYIDFSRNEIQNYSSLIGAIGGLLGVILLVETLWLQNKQFIHHQKLKEKEEIKNRIDLLKLLVIDLKSIKKDVVQRSKKVNEYFELLKQNPFYNQLLFRTSSRPFSRILEIDRASTFKGFREVFSRRIDWLDKYDDLFRIFDYLPEFFQDLYQKSDDYVKEQQTRKNEVNVYLTSLLDESTNYLFTLKEKYKMLDPLSIPSFGVVNELLYNNNELIKKSLDSEGRMVNETNFDELDSDVLMIFIHKCLELEGTDYFDFNLMPLMRSTVQIRRIITLMRDRGQEQARNLEKLYNAVFIDSEESEAISNRIETLIKYIEVPVNDEYLRHESIV